MKSFHYKIKTHVESIMCYFDYKKKNSILIFECHNMILKQLINLLDLLFFANKK